MQRTLFLLLVVLPLGPALVATGQETAWSQDDPALDQELRTYVLPLPGLAAPVPLAPHLDVRRVELWDDDVGLHATVVVEDLLLRTDRPTTSRSCFDHSEERLLLEFALAGTDSQYQVAVHLDGRADPGLQRFVASHVFGCLRARVSSQPAPWADGQQVLVHMDPEKEEIRLSVPWASLMGRAPIPDPMLQRANPAPWPEALPLQPRLEGLRLVSVAHVDRVSNVPLLLRLEDTVTGPDYEVRAAPANREVSVTLDAENRLLPVAAPGNTTATFTAVHHLRGKRHLEFEYEVRGPEGRGAHYTVFGPLQVALPSGEARRFRFSVTAEDPATLGDPLELVVRARVAGVEGPLGSDSVRLVPSAPLDPQNNRLYLHTRAHPEGSFPECAGGATTCTMAFLSAQKQDPRAINERDIEDRFVPEPEGGFATALLTHDLQDGQPHPLHFDRDTPLTMRLVIDLPKPVPQAHASIDLDVSNATTSYTLATLERTADLVSGQNELLFEGPVRLPKAVLPPGFRFGFFAVLRAGTEAGLATAQEPYAVRVKESYVELPLQELPPELRSDLPETPFQLLALGPTDEFVAPGGASLFDFTLLNQGQARHRTDLAVAVQPATWGAELRPGSAFDLQPGDMVRLALVLQAPPDAQEADAATVWVNASAAGATPASLRFTAVAASGVDIGSGVADYRADPEAQARLIGTSRPSTPGAAAGAAIVAVLCAFLARGRLS